jgi:hypothetical protein
MRPAGYGEPVPGDYHTTKSLVYFGGQLTSL